MHLPYETMAINKFHRSRLTFDFSAKVAHIGVPLMFKTWFSKKKTRSIELSFHMKIPYNKLAKDFTNCFCLMTKMATTPIDGKTH